MTYFYTFSPAFHHYYMIPYEWKTSQLLMMFSNPSWIPDFFCGFISHSVNSKHHHSWVPTVAYSMKHQIQTSSELHYWWTIHCTFQDGWLNMIGFSVCSLVLCCIPTWSWKTFCDVSTGAFGRNISKVSNFKFVSDTLFSVSAHLITLASDQNLKDPGSNPLSYSEYNLEGRCLSPWQLSKLTVKLLVFYLTLHYISLMLVQIFLFSLTDQSPW